MSNNKKSVTTDDLAVMVAEGFENLSGTMDSLSGRMGKVEHQMSALNSNVNNYLELSEKRYVELKQ